MTKLPSSTHTGSTKDIADFVATIPYCVHLGLSVLREQGRLVLKMPFGEHLVGNPLLPALHGGAISSLLEAAAVVEVMHKFDCLRPPQPVSINFEYLHSGRATTSFATAQVAQLGRRLVNVEVRMWQEDEAKPIAVLRGQFLLRPQSSTAQSDKV